MYLRELAAADTFKSKRSGLSDRILLEWEEKWVDKLNGWDLISRCFMFGLEAADTFLFPTCLVPFATLGSQ